MNDSHLARMAACRGQPMRIGIFHGYELTGTGSNEYKRFGENLLKHVHFTGRLSHAELSRLFPCADLAVFPSVIPEAYPLVLMESLSNGVLPLVSYFSGFKDGIDELAGLLGVETVSKMKISAPSRIRV